MEKIWFMDMWKFNTLFIYIRDIHKSQEALELMYFDVSIYFTKISKNIIYLMGIYYFLYFHMDF